jgi:hypothetical protein
MQMNNLQIKMTLLASKVLDNLVFKDTEYFIDYSNRLQLDVASNCKYQIIFRNNNSYYGSYYVLSCKTYYETEYYNLDRFIVDQNLDIDINRVHLILREQSLSKVLKFIKDICKN